VHTPKAVTLETEREKKRDINGRIRGDTLGRFTYCSRFGTSVVDYSTTDINPNFIINAFTVRPQLPITTKLCFI